MLKNIKDSLEISYKQGLESDDNIYIKGQIKDWEEMLSNIKYEQELKDNALKMYDEGQQKIERLNNNIENAIKKLEYYNGGEALYYVPIQNIIDILKGVDKE